MYFCVSNMTPLSQRRLEDKLLLDMFLLYTCELFFSTQKSYQRADMCCYKCKYPYVCTQEQLHYKDSIIHRVVPDFLIQMGDVTVKDGTGGR